jgi:2-dehydropantoate 2-reductase
VGSAEWARHHAPASMMSLPVEGRSRTGGSTWQSVTRGLPAVETDYLNGEIVLLGRLLGVPTPVNELLQSAMADFVRRGAVPGSVPPSALTADTAMAGVG